MARFSISRNGQLYGPYSLDELQRYLSSGHVLLSDRAQEEGSTDWIPVSELLPGVAAHTAAPAGGSAFPAGASPGYAPPLYSAATLNSPPNLHWGLVFLFDLLTCSIFQYIWNLVISSWFRRVAPGSRAFFLYIAATAVVVLQVVVGQILSISRSLHGVGHHGVYAGRGMFLHGSSLLIYALISLASFVVRLIARFTFRAELERHYNTVEPLHLQINPVMTFFFGGLYLQSIMNDVNDRRRMLAQGGYGAPGYGPR